jgi:hypothetical protein
MEKPIIRIVPHEESIEVRVSDANLLPAIHSPLVFARFEIFLLALFGGHNQFAPPLLFQFCRTV